jgi:spore germination cell wall hydrolase CwlJ-like protein
VYRLTVASVLLAISSVAHTPETNICYTPRVLSVSQLKCLADNVYHEGRGEPWKGQIAIARVTLNRAGALSNICTTVYKPHQFSWTKKPEKIRDKVAYATAELAAKTALMYEHPATHYHALHVAPKWASRLKYIETINNHKFYK